MRNVASPATLFDEPVDEPESPPVRPIGTRRTEPSYPLPRQISEGQGTSFETVDRDDQSEIDEASPSEDERMAEAALRVQDNVGRSQGQFFFCVEI